jgi:hypothetical protein
MSVDFTFGTLAHPETPQVPARIVAKHQQLAYVKLSFGVRQRAAVFLSITEAVPSVQKYYWADRKVVARHRTPKASATYRKS